MQNGEVNFNSVNVRGIGAQKVADIYYETIQSQLTSNASFRDARDGSILSCERLIGTDGIFPDDCTQVANAFTAVGILGLNYVPPSITPTVIQPPSITQTFGPITANSSTVLIFDTSGSMQEADAGGHGSKIQAAQSAGQQLLNVIKAENAIPGSITSQAALVHFSSDAQVDAPLSGDIQSLQPFLSSLSAGGATDMPDGLKLSIDLLQGSASASKKIVILLSDGMPNVGLGSTYSLDESTVRQQVLDLADQAGKSSICIFTVGFGDPNGSGDAFLDESFLREVSDKSGCGSYNNAQNSIQLANTYIQIRHSSTGNILLNQAGHISQGQKIEIGTASVPKNQALALFTLNWPGSQLDALLFDPSGRLVDNNYTNASITTTDTLISILVQNPLAGTWKIGAQGVDVPEGTTDYNAILSVRPNPQASLPPSTGLPGVIITIGILGVGVFVYVMTKVNKRSTPAVVTAGKAGTLIILSGSSASKSFPLVDGMTIGRGSTCQVRLSDSTVSRQHARLRLSGGHWYIQDIGSKTGILVNGNRVQAAGLNNGDRIRLGTVDLEFHTF